MEEYYEDEIEIRAGNDIDFLLNPIIGTIPGTYLGEFVLDCDETA